MTKIQEIGPVYTNRGSYLDCHEVLEQGQLRAIFLSKEDAQRFIRNETIRREEQGQFYFLPDCPPGIMPKVPVADMASLMEASDKIYETLLNRCLATVPMQHVPALDEETSNPVFEPPGPLVISGWCVCGREEDLPEPDAIVETK
jgi:hypothetical protein